MYNETFFLIDINECGNNYSSFCHDNATCYNTKGSYYCTCNIGYYGNGTTCSGRKIRSRVHGVTLQFIKTNEHKRLSKYTS